MSDSQSPESAVQTSSSKPCGKQRHRVSHTKSRNGCHTCKLRRVKCDEIRPVCGACSLRGSRCEYPSPSRPVEARAESRRAIPYRRNATRLQASDSAPADDQRGDSPALGVSLQPLDFRLTSPSTATPAGSLNMKDLRLMQHFLRRTCNQMSFDRKRILIWQQVIPDLAAKEEFLMHLLLALAGVHLMLDRLPTGEGNEEASVDEYPEADPIKLSDIVEHHQKGLQGLSVALTTLSPVTAEYICCGSTLLVGFAFASLRIRTLDGIGQLHEPGDNGSLQLDWLHLIRGLTSVIVQQWPVLKRGRLRSLLYYRHANHDWKDFPPSSSTTSFPRLKHCSARLSRFAYGASTALSDLRNFINTLKTLYGTRSESSASATPISQGSSTDYLYPYNGLFRAQDDAIDILKDMYMRILHILEFTTSERGAPVHLDTQADLEDTAVASWPDLLSNTFLASLNVDREMGIGSVEGGSYTILAHFYLIFTLYEEFWYLKGSFEREIAVIDGLIRRIGNGHLASLMRWPMEVLS